MKLFPAALHFFQDVRGSGCPDNGLWIGIVRSNVLLNCLDEFTHTAEHSSSDTVDREVAKETFHHVEPRGTCGGKVKVKSRISPLPCFNLVMLMGRIDVADNMALSV